MARRRKRRYDPNQLSLFDIIADHVVQIREENIQDDLRDEAAASPATETPKTPEPQEAVEIPEQSAIVEEIPTEPVRLGINANGASVYQMPDGSRMYSNNLGIMQVQDGDKLTPDMLYTHNRHEFLTIQEVAHFRNYTDLQVEVSNAPKTNRTSRNRPQGSQAGNDSGHQAGGIHQPGLLDTGSLGVEQPRRVEETGSGGEDSVRFEIVRPATDGSEGINESSGAETPAEWLERLGDIAGAGNRNKPENYRITAEDHLGSGGAKTKYADNIAAIRLLKQLQKNKAELATPEEKAILVRYVGWGGLPQVFDAKNEQWSKEYQELQGLLTPDEYQAARRSTQDAHYTSETVIRGIYQGLARIGAKSDEKLQVLEPSEGIGNFIGLAPEKNECQFPGD